MSAIAGRAPIMSLLSDGRCLHAGTLNAQNTVVAAALATLRFLENDSSRIYARLFKQAAWMRLGRPIEQYLWRRDFELNLNASPSTCAGPPWATTPAHHRFGRGLIPPPSPLAWISHHELGRAGL